MIELEIKVNGKRVGYLCATNIDPRPNGRFGSGELREYRIESARKLIGCDAIDRNFNATIARSADPFQFARDAINAVLDESDRGYE